MKILHISPDEYGGGAAKAAYRIHQALKASHLDSHMLVLKTASADKSIHIVPRSFARKIRQKAYKLFNKVQKKIRPVFHSDNPSLHSEGVENCGLVNLINNHDADVVNLHWINGMLSIKDIGNIKKPIFWTLHDMWPFCGAEHYTPDSHDARFKVGYLASNRPIHESGPDINRIAWEQKFKTWKIPMNIISPSNWMKNCVQESALMRQWPATQILNPIDTDYWKPLGKTICRASLNLPQNKKLIAFGAMGGGQNYYKGFELLVTALQLLANKIDDLELLVFGENRPNPPPLLGFPIHYMGHLSDDQLRLVYNAADALLIPSRMDNLPNTGVEAMACGVPIVAFNTGGLSDIVSHNETGWLAEAFSPNDLASGIAWVLNPAQHQMLSKNARERALHYFSYAKIAKQYLDVYKKVLGKH
ncbi:glycosyltransferase [Polynucleobacter sp. MWH-UH23A]|uniref:glycosyltransferase n=1 Tax=Polynucleobacter sp. MWH-UH23A TaxID=1855613 RepID=UPI003364E6F9